MQVPVVVRSHVSPQQGQHHPWSSIQSQLTPTAAHSSRISNINITYNLQVAKAHMKLDSTTKGSTHLARASYIHAKNLLTNPIQNLQIYSWNFAAKKPRAHLRFTPNSSCKSRTTPQRETPLIVTQSNMSASPSSRFDPQTPAPSATASKNRREDGELTLMASMAYSTWNSRPSGEKVFTPRSYSVLHPSQQNQPRHRPNSPTDRIESSSRNKIKAFPGGRERGRDDPITSWGTSCRERWRARDRERELARVSLRIAA